MAVVQAPDAWFSADACTVSGSEEPIEPTYVTHASKAFNAVLAVL
jgi:hypothetical protein